jgi:glycosyltransferase involved in cell wall biosynthesis
VQNVELSIVMPCLNEAETLGACIHKARRFLEEAGVVGEIVVADNGSTDDSRAIASALGVRTISVAARGYGAALLAGIAAAKGRSNPTILMRSGAYRNELYNAHAASAERRNQRLQRLASARE